MNILIIFGSLFLLFNLQLVVCQNFPDFQPQTKLTTHVQIKDEYKPEIVSKPRFLYDGNPSYDPPTLVWIPPGLEFECTGRTPGYYADPHPRSKCQVFHVCQDNGQHHQMLCGIGTSFNMRTFTCDFFYNYICTKERVEKDYARNDILWNQLHTYNQNKKSSTKDQNKDVEDDDGADYEIKEFERVGGEQSVNLNHFMLLQ